MDSDLEIRLAAARTQLILDKPFLGSLVLRMPLIKANPTWCKTTATDARAIYYNASYLEQLSFDHLLFLLSHEALHSALSHFARRQHRDKARWDVACDLAINPLLMDEGLTPSPDALFIDLFRGMTAEEIYPMLDEHEDLKPQDDHIYDEEEQEGGSRGDSGGSDDSGEQSSSASGGGSGEEEKSQGDGAEKPQPLTGEEREQMAAQWSQRMAGAAQMAAQAGKMGGELQRMIDHLLQPQLPWRMLLARYMTSTARDDYSYARPARREGSAILPTLHSHAIRVVVALDTSGSISDKDMRLFLSEVNAIKAQMNAQVTLIACDAALSHDGPWVYQSWEEFNLPREFHGGGGTDFRPTFKWLSDQISPPDLLIYFTDGQGRFPESEPTVPVIWLIKGKQTVPWGVRIQLN